MRRLIWLSVALALVVAYPLAVLDAVPAAARRAGAAVCDRGLGLEHRRRLCRPGLGRPCRVLRLRRLRRDGRVCPFRAVAAGRHPRRHRLQRGDRGGDRRADAAAVGALFQHGDDRGRRAGAADRHQHRISRRGRGAQRPDRAAQRLRSLLHLGAAVLLSVPRGPRDHARHHLVDDPQPDGILPARHQGFRARRALARRAGEPHQALRLSC